MAETHAFCVHRGEGGSDDKLYSVCGTIQANGDISWGSRRLMDRATHGSAGPAMAVFRGTIWLVYPAPGGDLKYTTWNASTQTWATDQNVGGRSDATVALVVFNDRLYCLHRGWDDEELYWCTNDGQGWSGDHYLANVQSAAGPGAIVYGGTLYALFRSKHPTQLLMASTFVANGSVPDYWIAAYQVDSYDKEPYTDGRPAPIVYRNRLYCVHADNDTRLAVCTLYVKTAAGHDPILQVENKDNANGDFKAGAGPAVAVTISNDEPTPKQILWALYRSNDSAGNLYFAYWQPGSSWDAGRWSREANIVGNNLSGEPAVLVVDNAVLRCCSSAGKSAKPKTASRKTAVKKAAAKKKAVKKKVAKKKAGKKAKPKRVAAKRRAPVRRRKPARKKPKKKR